MAYHAQFGDKSHRVQLSGDGSAVSVMIDEQPREVDARDLGHGTYSLIIEGRSYVADVTGEGDVFTVSIGGKLYRIEVLDEQHYKSADVLGHSQGGKAEVRAMMPGKVVDVLVKVGDQVERDQGLVTIEAMKMENEIRAPRAGMVTAVLVAAGQTVKTGDLLISLE